MKEYQKPFIEDEEIELEDVIAVSGGTRGGVVDEDGDELDPSKIW